MYFLLFDGESPRLIENADIELVLYNLVMSIITVIQIQRGGLLFLIRTVYWFLAAVHGDTRREAQFLKAMLTILCWLHPTPCAAHLVVLKISVGRDPKNPTTSFNGQNSNHNGRIPKSQLDGPISTDSFQNPQILSTISSEHDVIHNPDHFLSGVLL